MTLQAFIFTFAICTVVSVALIMLRKGEVYESVRSEERREELSKKMVILQRASAFNINESRLKALESKIDEKLSEIQDKADKTINDTPVGSGMGTVSEKDSIHSRTIKDYPAYAGDDNDD